jgi:HTH-type transcriptional regulator, transcriptional repressor of NAD biosynthesis genes
VADALAADGSGGNARVTLGVVIGKFLPPHRGHGLLIAGALSRCDELVVIVCDVGWHAPPAQTRAAWIEESFPTVRTLVCDQDALGLSDDDSEGWARATRDLLGRAPDLVFTSEDYGPRYASFLGADHVRIDREGSGFSGTAIRQSPQTHLDWLEPHVRAHYVARVCVLGAESTGKSRLAADLAAHYGVRAVPEFGRAYTEAMPDPPRYRWRAEDFRLIAEAQAALEDDTARWTPPPLICDTNPFVTAVFHEAYLGVRDPELERAACARRYDLFVLTDPDTPFEQDGTGMRVDGARREWMHRWCADYADAAEGEVVRVTGGPEERRTLAVRAIDALLTR